MGVTTAVGGNCGLQNQSIADEAEKMAETEGDPKRAKELRVIARICRVVPENPPAGFYEAIQFLWFTQVGGILSENPLALNPGRFDQYMNPYYEADLAKGSITEEGAQELIEALWLKYSEWVWTISANTADYEVMTSRMFPVAVVRALLLKVPSLSYAMRRM